MQEETQDASIPFSDLVGGLYKPRKATKTIDNEKEDETPSKIKSNYVMHWADIEVAAKCNSEYRQNVFEWIETHLGYVPHESICMPYMALAQTIIKNATEGIVSLIDASLDFSQLARNIRRDDMLKGGWVKIVFDDFNKRRYETQLKEYKQKARDRLCNFLCEEIPIEHSFLAEIYLRNAFTTEIYYEGMDYCGFDMKAGTIAYYRQAYHTKGQEAADDLPLLGSMYGYHNPHGQLKDED